MATGGLDHHHFAKRVAQSVARQEIPDRSEASYIGQRIAAFAIEHWLIIKARYGIDTTDELEIVERFTQDVLAQSASSITGKLQRVLH